MSLSIFKPPVVLTDPPLPPEALALVFIQRRARVTPAVAGAIRDLMGLGSFREGAQR